MAFIGTLFQIFTNEYVYYTLRDLEPGFYNAGLQITVLKSVNSLFTIGCLWMCYVHYADKLSLKVAYKHVGEHYTLNQAGLLNWMLFEMALLSIHSPPFLDRAFELSQSHSGNTYMYTYDAVSYCMPYSHKSYWSTCCFLLI